MKGKFLSNIGFLLILNLLIKGAWILGIDRVVQNTVGASEYGNYYALLNFTFLFSILIDLGITNYNNRRIAQDRSLLSEYLPGLLALKFLLSLGYLLVVAILALVLGYSDQQLYFFIPLLALNQILLSFILYIRSNLGGLHLFRTDSLISVLDRGLMILFGSVLLWGLPQGIPFRIEWFVLAQTGAYVITAVTGGLIVLRKSGRIRINWDPSFFLGILRKSAPYALLVLLMTFYNRMDGVMLERLLPEDGKVQAGIYAQGFRILDAVSQFAFLFSTMLLPLFATAFEKGEWAELRELLGTASRSLLPIGILLAVICCFHALPIMELLYHEHQKEASLVFAVLILSFIPVCLSYIHGTLLTAKGAMKWMNILAGGGMLLNGLLNLVLIPYYGALGSATATIITQGGAATGQTVLSLSLLRTESRELPYFRGSAFILILLSIGFFLSYSGLRPLYSFLLHGMLGLLAIPLTGLFRIHEGKRLLKGVWKEEDDRA